jgi:hypothetical protein
MLCVIDLSVALVAVSILPCSARRTLSAQEQPLHHTRLALSQVSTRQQQRQMAHLMRLEQPMSQ